MQLRVAGRPRQPGMLADLVTAHRGIPCGHVGGLRHRPQPRQVAHVGLALVEQGREVADPEVRIVGGVAAHLRAQAQVAPHQRRDGQPGGRLDVVESRPSTVTGRYGRTVYSRARARLRTKSRTPRICAARRLVVAALRRAPTRSRSRSRSRSGPGRRGCPPTSAAPRHRCGGPGAPRRGPSRPATAAARRGALTSNSVAV